MTQAVSVTYDGKTFVPDENVTWAVGQKAVVTILDNEEPLDLSEAEIRALIERFSGSGGKITKGGDAVDEYLTKLRSQKKIDFAKYAGSAGKLFKNTEEIDNYVRSLRDNDRI